MTEPTPGPRPRAALAMSHDVASAVLDPESRAALDALCDLAPTVLEDFTTPTARAVLADRELLVTGWGCPPLDDDVLRAAPGCGPSSTPPAASAAMSPTPAGTAASRCPPPPRPTPSPSPSTPSR